VAVTRAPAVLTGVAWAVLVVEQTAAPGRFWPAAVVPLKVVARVARLPAEDPRPRPQPLVVPFTEWGLSVLRLLAEGHGNREIAAALFLAEGTVKNHVANVQAKLGARDRTQAALRARALELL
jgi:DNA-binding NarL/FixJ family response regulator